MAKRWSAEDIRDLKTLAQEYSVQAIAEKIDRTVGGVAFKAQQLGLPLKARSQATVREFADLDWTKSDNAPPAVRRMSLRRACGLEAKFRFDAVSAAG
jgi:hypothetical protein